MFVGNLRLEIQSPLRNKKWTKPLRPFQNGGHKTYLKNVFYEWNGLFFMKSNQTKQKLVKYTTFVFIQMVSKFIIINRSESKNFDVFLMDHVTQ